MNYFSLFTVIIDDSVIVSNAFVFFVAGFETTASTLGFCLYELSLHQDVQEQAYQHILSVLKKHGGEITYDAVKEMTFLNQIFAGKFVCFRFSLIILFINSLKMTM